MSSQDSLDVAVALLRQEIGHQTRKIEELENKIDKAHEKVAKIEEMASRWKGGFLVVAGIGGLLGWVASIWDKVTKPWH